jgi:putative methionine-R-sulfoxide reductase with GAF domain
VRRRRVASRKPAKAPQRIKAKRSGASKAVRNRRPPALSKDTEVARLTRERDEAQKHLTEALEQQTTTSEILGIVARSPVDVQSVLDAVCKSAAQLCEAYDAVIRRPDGDRLLVAAHYGPIPLAESSIPLTRGMVVGRSVLDKRTLHIADILTQADEFPESSEGARHLGWRTALCVPLMREGVVIGAITLRRSEVQLFTERQVALLQTFANQAVIAIENARLLNELHQRTDDLSESLEQQTATADVLQVISSSSGELEPVFKAMLENAVRICEAGFGVMFYYREGIFSPAAELNVPKGFSEFIQQRGSFRAAAGHIRAPCSHEAADPSRRRPAGAAVFFKQRGQAGWGADLCGCSNAQGERTDRRLGHLSSGGSAIH